MVEITLSIMLQILQTVSILVGIVYYLFIMRNSQRNQQMQLDTRQAQLFMQIYNRYDEQFGKAYYTVLSWEWTDYKDFMEQYGEFKNPDIWSANVSKVASYFEGVGVLVRRNMIDPTLVGDLMSSNIISFWEKMEPIIKQYRVENNIPQKWDQYEYLYNIIKPLRTNKVQPS